MRVSEERAPTAPEARRATVDFWFDPVCPFAWATSRWVVEVAQSRPLDARWHLMSLYLLNQGRRDISSEFDDFLTSGRHIGRVFAAAAAELSDEVLGDLYTAFGELVHVQGRPREVATVVEALPGCGLPESLVAAWDDPTWDAAVAVSHERAIDAVGEELGTPVLAIDGTAYFGPVLAPVPTGPAALRLWDGLRMMASVPGFAELKRARGSL
jgi:2-hydroxychromene-2-carboxylate isomerase